MSERTNSLEHRMGVQKNNERIRKEWIKINFLNFRVNEELGNNPSTEEMLAFKLKYEGIFTSLGQAVEINPERGDEDKRTFRWKEVKGKDK